MNRSRIHVLPVAVLLICSIGLLVSAGSLAKAQGISVSTPNVETAPQTAPSDPKYLSGLVKYVDPRYGYSLELQEGWIAYPSDPNATIGSTTICNYDPQAIEDLQLSKPEDAVCLQLGVGRLDELESFARWMIRKRASELDPSYGGRGAQSASELTSVGIGVNSGAAFLVINTDGTEVLEIDFPSGENIMAIAVSPANSPGVPEALQLLSSLKLMPLGAELNVPNTPYFVGESIPNQIADLEFLLAEKAVYLLPNQLGSLLEVARSELIIGSPQATQSCSGAGLFDKGEAPTSPISLWVPFKAGETWIVGGSGSFYGNGFHGNCLNDYYATDWNRSNDYNADVLPAAPGSITNATSPCKSTGLGCSVGITHGSGIKTTYGHLSQIYKTSGEAKLGERIGAVGETGCPGCGPHLHLGIHKLT